MRWWFVLTYFKHSGPVVLRISSHHAAYMAAGKELARNQHLLTLFLHS